MHPSPHFDHHPDLSVGGLSPLWATIATVITTAANSAVWLNEMKDWAATITIIVGAPTAVLLLIYWFIKVADAIQAHRHK